MAEHTYKKEVSGYSDSTNNYIAPDEITVTITLREYRELVTTKASFEDAKSKLTSEKYALQSERDALKKQLEELSGRLLRITAPESFPDPGVACGDGHDA